MTKHTLSDARLTPFKYQMGRPTRRHDVLKVPALVQPAFTKLTAGGFKGIR
jgi:hypothetical protein